MHAKPDGERAILFNGFGGGHNGNVAEVREPDSVQVRVKDEVVLCVTVGVSVLMRGPSLRSKKKYLTVATHGQFFYLH